MFETRRLRLRRFRPSDLPVMAALHADPGGMETLGAPLDRAASDALVARFDEAFEKHGFLDLGLSRDPDGDFEHPRVPEGSPLRPHVLYRLRAGDWRRRRS